MNMMGGSVHLWNKTSDLGITDDMNREERRRVRLLNQFAFIIISAGIPALIYSLLIGMYYDVIVILFTHVIFFDVLYLQYKRQYHKARLFLNIASPLFIISIIMILRGYML